MPDSKTILIADDDRMIRIALRESLRGGFFRLLEAADGTDAVALAHQERPDLVLLDIGLPGLDGREVLTELKNNPATIGMKVVMVTGRDHPRDRQYGFDHGADGYITKPFSPLAVLTYVRGLLG